MRAKIFVLLFILISATVIWRLNVLSIDTVKINSLAECGSQEGLKREVNSADKNWILLDSNKIKTQLMSKYPCIKNIRVEYEFPKTLNVTIFGRKFLAKVIQTDFPINFPDLESSSSSQTALLDWNFPTESSEDAFVVDDEGFIFNKVKYDYSIPTIFLDENINFGLTLNSQQFKATDQIFSNVSKIAPFSYQPNFKAKKYGETLIFNTSPKLAFSLERDVLKQLASLQLILQKAKIDEKVVDFIDLRFDKPVVQFHSNLSK